MKTLTAALILLTASPPIQAFFCFSFGSGGGFGSRYLAAHYPPPYWTRAIPAVVPVRDSRGLRDGRLPPIVPASHRGALQEHQGWRFRPLK